MNSPYIKLKIDLKNLKKIKVSNKDNNFNNNNLYIFKNFNLKNKIFKTYQVILIGNPIIKNFDNFFNLFEKYSINSNKIKNEISKINGQFLIIVNLFKKNKFFIINDRFSSIPIYVLKINNSIYFSHLYHDLNFINDVQKLKLNQLSFLQVIFFNRMFGENTFHNEIKYLLPATLCNFSEKKNFKTKYWFPNFKNKIKNFNDEVGQKYIYLLRNSINRNLKEYKKNQIGIFLSGGHDSRSVLLASKEKKPLCLSISFSNNYEIKVAKKVSKSLNLTNKFIKLEKNHFEKNINLITRINSGFYSFIDTLFVGIDNQIPKKIKILIHGHGLDYMFQGMYLPFRWIKIFKRPTFFKKIENLNKIELTNYFMNNISYRVKGINIFDYIIPIYKKGIRNYLLRTLNKINTKAKKKSFNKYDNWESFIVDTLGRHYSYPNVLSKLSLREQRIISFDNDLFDFYLSLDPKIRLNAYCMQYLMNSIDKNVGKIETGNWGLPANDGPLKKTLKLILRKIIRHITFNQNFKAPTSKDRTWPTTGDYLRNSKFFKKSINEMTESKNFKKLLFYFDWAKINQLKEELLKKKNNNGDRFFAILLTLYFFLKKIKKI